MNTIPLGLVLESLADDTNGDPDDVPTVRERNPLLMRVIFPEYESTRRIVAEEPITATIPIARFEP